jgi:aspartate aminotransferase
MGIASKIKRDLLRSSWIRQMFETGVVLKRKHGERNVFDLSLGNPLLEPPEAFFRELRRLAEDPPPGMHRYMPNSGYRETRSAVAVQLALETGVPFEWSNVIMTCGAGGALNVLFKAILDPEDEVVLFSPYFGEYPFYVDNHGGISRMAPTDERFLPKIAVLEGLLGPRTKAVLINSPNNPSGVVYSAELLRVLGETLRRAEEQYQTQIYLVSDEPYARLIFDGLDYPRVFGFHPSAVVATSYSKDLSLAGERIGYLAVHPECPGGGELMDALTHCTRVLGFVNAPALMQHIVRNLQGVAVDSAWYERRRDYLYRELTDMGYSVVKPQGAFYMFPRSPLDDDLAFVQDLQDQNVLVVPGTGFGSPGHFRISYAVEDWVLEGAMEGLRRAAISSGLSV